jgi:hypothetical protein
MITRDEHAALRAGRITGSIAQRIMTSSRSAWNTIARDLRNPRPFYDVENTPNMPAPLAWGQTHERQAAGEFWFRHPEFDVHDPKFMHWHDPTDTFRVRHYGFSPDRSLSRAGYDTPTSGLEIKCPYDGEEHVETIKGRCLPLKYKWQVYMGMYVSGFEDWWFTSFDPRVTEPQWRSFDLHIVPDHRDMEQLAATLSEFLEGFLAGETFAPASLQAQDLDKMF